MTDQPTARGLFGRAIAQSVPGTSFSRDLARDVSVELTAPRGLAPPVDALGLAADTPSPFSPVEVLDLLH